jgi:hypothetical protein
VGREDLLSVTTAYRGTGHPVFVTSDSVLAAYDTLLRELTAGVAWTQGEKLRAALSAAHARLASLRPRFDLDGDLRERSERRARIVLATARLLFGDVPVDRPGVLEVARTEAAHIEAGEGVRAVPAWCGPASPGFAMIDDSRFRPTGTLAEIPETARTYRAIAWLSWMPFRVEREEELVAFLILAAAIGRDAAGGLDTVLGAPEDLTIGNAPEIPARVTMVSLGRLRSEIARSFGPPAVRDLPTMPGVPGAVTGRVLGPSVTPDARLLQDLADARVGAGEPGLPTALAVAAALGSGLAAERLPACDRGVLFVHEEFAKGPALHDRYLRCLGLLLGPPHEKAPALFSGDAWRTKSLQTVLAGYTVWHHAWDLWLKDGTVLLGGRRAHAGFVEPVPDFYRTLAGIVDETAGLLPDRSRDRPGYESAVLALVCEALARVLTRVEFTDAVADASGDEFRRHLREMAMRDPLLARKGDEARRILWLALRRCLGDRRVPRTLEDRVACVTYLRERAAAFRRGEGGRSRADRASLAQRFALLKQLLEGLASLAEKQIAGDPFDEKDARWLRAYGHALGRVMGEGSYPTDDAPAAVSVFSDPARCLHLIEAVGRPRPLWILYPSGDEEVLCLGAALTWYEFHAPRPPTDAQFKAMLDSGSPPARPAVVRDIEAD